MYIYSWQFASEGAKNLALALKARRIKHENSQFKGNPKKIVINWGSSQVPEEVLKCNILNKPDAVRRASNKLEFFNTIAGKASCPDWTTSPKVAMDWVADGDTVCARTILSGHSAAGLVLMSKDDLHSFVEAPLYTKYIPKKDEYRVHVVNGEVIDIQRKALRNGWIEDNDGQKPNFKIRNLANGFVYIRNDINPPSSVLNEAVRATVAIGLDFGAVDLVYNEKRQTAYTLEINSAPGLEGTTVENYANAFRKKVK